MKQVRAGYFMDSAEALPDLTGYDVLCIHDHEVHNKTSWLKDMRSTGLTIYHHKPACYWRDDWLTPGYGEHIVEYADKHGSWLEDDDGDLISCGNCYVLDMRYTHGFWDEFSQITASYIDSLPFISDGLLLDCVWDNIPGRWGNREEHNKDWERGMKAFVHALRNSMKSKVKVYGNGANTSRRLTGNMYEGWPWTWCGINNPNRNEYTMLYAPYGVGWYNKFYREAPMYIPASKGADLPGDNVYPQRTTACVAYAAAYTPGAIVFENSGVVLEAIKHLKVAPRVKMMNTEGRRALWSR